MQPANFPRTARTQVTHPPDRRPPATPMRAHTVFNETTRRPRLLRVRNEASWPASEFREYLDVLMASAGIPNDAALSRAAGIDASLISNWRSGKQQPSRRSLKKVAAPLGVKPVALYLQAGLDAHEDFGLADAPDLTVWPREFHQLHEVYTRFAEQGRGQDVLDAMATLALGLEARIGKPRPSGRRKTG
jgi:transcriptional regulator with XRE-family HTH domain